jgi:RNA polymerase sigma-70 factor (ECF subfamily)
VLPFCRLIDNSSLTSKTNTRARQQQKVIQASRKGNRTAQRALYDKYRSKWFTICLRYTRDRDDALDAMQNAMVSIYSRLDTFDPAIGSFQAWSSRIVINDCIMLLRKKNGAALLEDKYAGFVNLIVPENAVEKMSAAEIVKLINGLPDGYRMIFNLFAIEGYAHKEIAQMLDISIGTSKSQLFKAKKMLQENIKDIFEISYR